ncbi:single insulin-like growth factor-binding domain protein-2 [Hyalella azteca]|uniref:Single insulin-like growth factor-binding domain protein-2 n=1 Tax=Hyalella azteca TaxID=294128 RepID=A0A8B7PPV0_HYAAZ|nr:single insulin-like growth factor-binding domain protein-2 [Hyalella azteca]
MSFKALLVLLLSIYIHCVGSLRCVPCGGKDRCPPDPPVCINGLVSDVCECCMVCGKGEGDVCGGLWNMRGKCGDGLVCVKPQSYPEQASYPEGKCRSHPTKRPLIQEDEIGNVTTTTETPIATTTTTTTTTTVKIETTPTREDPDLNLDLLNALTYRQWVRQRLRN